MDAIPLIMRTVTGQFRQRRPLELSIPQFRVLLHLRRHEGGNLSALAEHIGLSLPTMSKMVDGLVKRGFVVRNACEEDRRRMVLSLTKRGANALSRAREGTESRIAQLLAGRSPRERRVVCEAMEILRGAFDPTEKIERC